MTGYKNKKNQILFPFYALTIFSFTSFSLVYGEDKIFALVSLSLLSLLLFGFYRIFCQNKKWELHLPVLLVVGFWFMAVYGLGDKHAPETYYTMEDNLHVEVDLDGAYQIDRFCYFRGIDRHAKVSAKARHNDNLVEIHKYTDDFPNSFRWACEDMKSQNIVADSFTMDFSGGEVMIGEVKVYSGGKPLELRSDALEIVDEPQLPIGTTYYHNMFFDEAYHGRSGYELYTGESEIYESTHPYLGKIIIAEGIRVFGMNPFGWRIAGVIFATLLVGVMYYVGSMLFRKRYWGAVSAFLMTFSLVHFSESRMASIDTFGVLFVLLSFYFLYLFIEKQSIRNLWLSGLFFGLASGIKWSSVFASFGFLLILAYLIFAKHEIVKKYGITRLLSYGVLSYLILAFGVYTATFYPLILDKRMGGFVEYQIGMFDYHAMMTQPHPYSSPWWSWPLMLKPIIVYSSDFNFDKIVISVTGNPAIFWTGIMTMLFTFYMSIKTRALLPVFISLAFISLYFPYVFIGRAMFLYHFYYALPFVMLSIVYTFTLVVRKTEDGHALLYGYLAFVVFLFLVFYPVVSGYSMPEEYFQGLRWLERWWF